MAINLDSKIPNGPIESKWKNHKFSSKLVNPANKRKHSVIVVGTGLAGASAAASLGELGYKVKAFCVHESPRRAHSVAAQGGIFMSAISNSPLNVAMSALPILPALATMLIKRVYVYCKYGAVSPVRSSIFSQLN